jgi:transposase
MTATTAPPVVEVAMDEIEAILEEAKRLGLAPEHLEKLRAIVESYRFVLSEIEDKKATIRTLRQLVFGARTETKANVVGATEEPSDGSTEESSAAKPKPKRKGHGRKPAKEYTGAEKVEVRHPSLRPGDRCPCGCGGILYRQKGPAVLVRIRAAAPFRATVYEKERLRSSLCGQVFVADSPPGVGEEKFDATVGAMEGVLRYGTGVPMNRIAGLQQAVGVPFPVSTQWKILADSAKLLERVHEELVRRAAQGVLFINDDTPMKILSFLADLKKRRERGEKPERTGCQTSGIVSELPDGHEVVLYFTGVHHAGENLADVLKRRAKGLETPMQMCDALDRNLPEPLKTILGNCLVHARRQMIRVNESFPFEVKYVVDELAIVYKNEARARAEGMTPEQRLRFHQEESGPVMDRLKAWMDDQIEEKRTEPNSGLGKAIEYSRKRWDRLTLFLREPGAPLDSNLVERMLKRAIIHRKASLFYKTEIGAAVGDLFMSLIGTAKLAGVDPFDYLTELLRHPKKIAASPGDWMPWNYATTLGRRPPPT